MQTALSGSGGCWLCIRRAPADPAKRPSLLVPLEGSRELSPPRPGHRSHRERLWAIPATAAKQLQPPARPRQRTGISGKLRQRHRNYVIRRSFSNGSRKLDYSSARLFVDDTSSGAEAPSEGLAAGHGADTGGKSPRVPGRARSRGGAASQVSRQRLRDKLEAAAGCSLLSSRARDSVRGTAGKGVGAPRGERGAVGGAGTDLASGAVPQHHQLELAVRTLLLLRVRHDLYGPGEKEEAESSREEPGAGARTGQGEERALRSRSRQQRRNQRRHLPSVRPPSLWSARGETNNSAEGRGGSSKLQARATATSPATASGHTHFFPPQGREMVEPGCRPHAAVARAPQ